MRATLSFLILLALVVCVLPAWQGRAEMNLTTLAATGDSYVDKGAPAKPLGSRSQMRADRSPVKIIYLRFPESCSADCTLSVFSATELADGPRVYTTRNFSESTLTWNTQPRRGTYVGNFGKISVGWNTIPIKATSSRVFRLEADSSTQFVISSRESYTTSQAKLGMARKKPTPTPSPTARPSSTPVPYATAAATSTRVPSPTSVPTQPLADNTSITLPVRAAFYYPWFPNAWTQGGVFPYTKFKPSLGYYDGGDPAVIRAHIDAMLYGGITVGIASWWGQGHQTDRKVPTLLSQADGTGFKWAFYYEPEGTTNPSQAQLTSDLSYLVDTYGSNPNAARVDGRLVIFVYNANDLDCSVVERYRAANTAGAYVVLKVFSGYRSCAAQPDGWHQYAPAVREDHQRGYSFAISPSFDKIGEATRLARDPEAWPANVRNMVASGAPWQLVTTFNEWGEGTGIEGTTQYPSSSGYGYYLDVLHANGETGAVSTSMPILSATPAPTQPPPTATVEPTRPPETAGFTVAAVGDIMHETSSTAFDRADLVCQLAGQDDVFLALGDLQYENGSYDLFMSRYDVSACGEIKSKTKPVPGNHEYNSGGGGYYQYFGALAGDPAKGYYSFNAGGMHFIAINSNCSSIQGGCGTSGAQYTWLRADLAANPSGCTVAFWHHPRYSSGNHGDNPVMDPIWDLLATNGGDIVLAGHDHTYERFAPMDANGNVTGAGIREFVVGTGGKSFYAFGVTKPNSQVRIANVSGILRLSGDGAGYRWQFIGIDGNVYDEGTGSCANMTSGTATATPSPSLTSTPVPDPTGTATLVPTVTAVPTDTVPPSDTPVPTATPTDMPADTPTEVPSVSPIELPTDTPAHGV